MPRPALGPIIPAWAAQPPKPPQPAETLVLTVEEASDLLAISPQAVRKRIAKGTLPARKLGGAWQVFLERATVATGDDEPALPPAQPRTQPPATGGQPQAAQLAALVEPFTGPPVARIEALGREAERERLRAEAAEAERDALAAEVGRLRSEQDAPQAAPAAPESPEPAGAAQYPVGKDEERHRRPATAVGGRLVGRNRRRAEAPAPGCLVARGGEALHGRSAGGGTPRSRRP